MLEKIKISKLKELVKGKREVSNIIFIPCFVVTYIVCILIATSQFMDYIGYTGYLYKNTATTMVNRLEEEYLYQKIFNTEEYKILKDELFDNKVISKQDYRKFLDGAKDLAEDEFSFYLFDDYIRIKKVDRVDRYTKAIKKSTDNLKYEIKNKELGYISFTEFKEETGDKFIKALEHFKENDIKNLIIDLRKNRGGNTDEANIIADALLPEGQMLRLKFLKEEIIYYSDESHIEFDKIFVFLSEESASCAEILPLSLKENLESDKVILIGNKTRKKDVGQTTYQNDSSRFYYGIVSNKWYVYDKDVDDLNEYLKSYDIQFNIDDDGAYYDIVYKNLNNK